MKIEIKPKPIFVILLSVITLLLAANISGIVVKFYFDHDYVFGLIPLFDFDTEQNIPTMFSSFTLLCSSLLLLIIALSHKKQKSSFLPWVGLSIIFLFLSIDETASIHEGLAIPVRNFLGTSGILFFAWVIPYGIGFLLLSAVYLRFFIKLPKRIIILLTISASTYLSGAIGMEMISGIQSEAHGINNITFAMIYTTEELLEMLGIAIFIYTLLIYISTQFKGATFYINN